MRQRIIPAVAEKIVAEKIMSITIDNLVKTVTVILGELSDSEDENSSFVDTRVVTLGNEGYQLLIETDSPEWAVGKPVGEFRTTDVFSVMDILGK